MSWGNLWLKLFKMIVNDVASHKWVKNSLKCTLHNSNPNNLKCTHLNSRSTLQYIPFLSNKITPQFGKKSHINLWFSNKNQRKLSQSLFKNSHSPNNSLQCKIWHSQLHNSIHSWTQGKVINRILAWSRVVSLSFSCITLKIRVLCIILELTAILDPIRTHVKANWCVLLTPHSTRADPVKSLSLKVKLNALLRISKIPSVEFHSKVVSSSPPLTRSPTHTCGRCLLGSFKHPMTLKCG